MSSSPISFVDTSTPRSTRILQLYEHLELYQEGEPPENTLFVLERAPLSVVAGESANRLLIIDPPLAALGKFRLEGGVTTLFTGDWRESGLPTMQTMVGGVAHLKIGQHYLDIYSQRIGNIVHFPALGILCSGLFGSDATLPRLAPGSNGDEELETLRLLAQLVKRRVRLLLPQTGSLLEEPTLMMQRLADDVGYLHSLRRVAPGLLESAQPPADIQKISASLLPSGRRSPLQLAIHEANLSSFLSAGASKTQG